MKIKKWFAAAGAAAVLGGVLLTGIPAGATAAGMQAGTGKNLSQNANYWCGGAGMGMQGARRGGGAGMGLRMGQSGVTMSSAVAEFLGMDVTELRTARQSGKSLAQIAKDKGKSEQELIDFMIKNRTAQLDQLVSEGKITQAQADFCKQNMETRIKTNVERTSIGRPVR